MKLKDVVRVTVPTTHQRNEGSCTKAEKKSCARIFFYRGRNVTANAGLRSLLVLIPHFSSLTNFKWSSLFFSQFD